MLLVMHMKRIIMHIDVNNAFLSWTAVDLLNKGYNIDIRKIEAVIGGDESKRHGIVLAKSPIAKKRGVKTAETLMSARRKCRDLKVYPPDYQLYKRMSNAVFEIIKKYTPDIEIISIDECFIDYTKVYQLYGDPIKFAYHLKDEIYNTLKFTVNVGIANNKLCAKMASDFEKPNKVHTLFEYEVERKMYPLPIGELYGIGKSTSAKLIELNIKTVGDLAKTNPEMLKSKFKNQAEVIVKKAQGIDDSVVNTEADERKGISHSTTFAYNLRNLNTIYKCLQALVENVCVSLRREKKYASVVSVTIKDREFKTYSRQKKLINETDNTDEIFSEIKKLFNEAWDEEPIRLLGVGVSHLTVDKKRQLSLFEEEENVEKNSELDKVIDKLKSQYGVNIVQKASLIDSNISKKYD